jgi:glycosyltransferase involved in cell wall biosynthesis
MQILALITYYLPGCKSGGPIRTLAGMTDRLGDRIRFRLITSDRDVGDAASYSDVTVDAWQRVGKAEVRYASPAGVSLAAFRKLIRATEHDVLYLNSLFAPVFTIRPLLLRRLGLLPERPLIVAPRGELAAGALALGWRKKRAYLAVASALDLYRGAVWQASSEYEASDIRRRFGPEASVVVAPNLSAPIDPAPGPPTRRGKRAESLKVLFLARITRVKNLDGALKMLAGLRGEVQFNIYGPLDDPVYWEECQRIMRRLPPNIEARYHGMVAHDQVAALMGRHDLFFLPTMGENFGHAILESLVAGCPVLISDRTPWRALQDRGVGWDLDLERPEGFHAALQRCVAMEGREHEQWCRRAREYGLQWCRDERKIEQNEALFRTAVSDASRRDHTCAASRVR